MSFSKDRERFFHELSYYDPYLLDGSALAGRPVDLDAVPKFGIPFDLLGLLPHPECTNGVRYLAGRPHLEDFVTIEGNVVFGDNVVVRKGTTIRGNIWIGDDVEIGSYAIIRGSTILDNGVHIDSYSDIKNSILLEGSQVGPLCFLGESLLGRRAFLGALVRTSNVRLDRGAITVLTSEGVPVPTDRMNLGAFIGSHTSIGIGCVLFPGRIVGSRCTIWPGVQIKKNLSPNRRIVLVQDTSIEEVQS